MNYWSTISLFILFLSLTMGAVLRYISGLPLVATYTVCLIAVPTLAAIVIRKMGHPRNEELGRKTPQWKFLIVALFPACASLLIYGIKLTTLAPMGLYGLGSVDAASHLSLLISFVFSNAQAYDGFVGFYGFVWIFYSVFGLSFPAAIAMGVYSHTVLIFLLIGLVITGFWTDKSKFLFKESLLSLFLLLFVGFKLFLPLVFYNIGEGFWPHLAALVIPLFILLICLTVHFKHGAVFLVLVCVGLYRFYYGLNLGDMLAALSALLLLEGKSYRGLLRKLYGAGGLLMAAMAGYSYYKIMTIMEIGEGVLQHQITLANNSAWMLCGSFAVFLFANRRSSFHAKRLRQLFFILAFCVFNLLFQSIFLSFYSSQYYIYKYGLHAVFLLSVLVVVVTPSIIKSIYLATRHRRYFEAVGSLVILIFVISGTEGLSHAYGSYRVQQQKVFKDPNEVNLLYHPNLVDHISSVLEREGEKFVLFLGRAWPSVHFTNVLIAGDDGRRTLFQSMSTLQTGIVPPGEGCLFWAESPIFRTTWRLPEIAKTIEKLSENADSVCEVIAGDVKSSATICHLCSGR